MYIGIDTSCYTTSVAAINEAGALLADLRRVLQVSPGERGLQQSAALFQHVQNLPALVQELSDQVDLKQAAGIGVSTRPRPVEGSYMPVFTVAAGTGQVLSAALGAALVATSHQEGHIMAGLWSSGQQPKHNKFLVVHLSGGTTELLLVEANRANASGPLYNASILGGTTDLHAGQFIDRVGVRLGLNFPAGPRLEELAKAGSAGQGLIPSSVRGYDVSFSGPESHAQRLIDNNTTPQLVARAVEACIVKTLAKLLSRGMEDYQISEVLLVGGVAANAYIRNELTTYFKRRGSTLIFAQPSYSSDNAVGTAEIARTVLTQNHTV